MTQFSNEILNYIGGPGLSELKACQVKELPHLPNCLDAAIWNFIFRVRHPDDAVYHLDLAILKHTLAAAESYTLGRTLLIRFIDRVDAGKHDLLSYLSAVRNFEYCVGAIWKAAEAFNKMEHKALDKKFKGCTLFVAGDGSELNRINELNGVAKHYNAHQAAKASAHIWISENGIECANCAVTFDEIFTNIVALSEISRQSFVDIPQEAMNRANARRRH